MRYINKYINMIFIIRALWMKKRLLIVIHNGTLLPQLSTLTIIVEIIADANSWKLESDALGCLELWKEPNRSMS